MDELYNLLDEDHYLNSNFCKYSKIYTMTTENIYEFINHYNLENKDVLTVMGSGDHALNSYLLGAKTVTCFDINPLAQIMYDLKRNIILNYDLNDFLDFFDIKNYDYISNIDKFDKNIIKELKNKLNNNTYEFFNYFYTHRMYFDDIFYHFNYDLNTLSNMNGYLNEDSYDYLKDILNNKDINFIESNIIDLKNKLLNKKYDLILLSNISDYIYMIYPNNSLNNYYNLIMDLVDNLNNYGIIEVGYLYAHNHRHPDDFNSDIDRNKIFTTDKFHSVLVKSFDDLSKKDKIITYQKIKY